MHFDSCKDFPPLLVRLRVPDHLLARLLLFSLLRLLVVPAPPPTWSESESESHLAIAFVLRHRHQQHHQSSYFLQDSLLQAGQISKICSSTLCWYFNQDIIKTSQELRMMSSVTINWQVTKIVTNPSGSQLSLL